MDEVALVGVRVGGTHVLRGWARTSQPSCFDAGRDASTSAKSRTSSRRAACQPTRLPSRRHVMNDELWTVAGVCTVAVARERSAAAHCANSTPAELLRVRDELPPSGILAVDGEQVAAPTRSSTREEASWPSAPGASRGDAVRAGCSRWRSVAAPQSTPVSRRSGRRRSTTARSAGGAAATPASSPLCSLSSRDGVDTLSASASDARPAEARRRVGMIVGDETGRVRSGAAATPRSELPLRRAASRGVHDWSAPTPKSAGRTVS